LGKVQNNSLILTTFGGLY